MSATRDFIFASEPSASPRRPSRQINLVPPETIALLHLQAATIDTARGAADSESMTAQPLTAATVMTIDEEGSVVVSDIIGAVYGAGASESEARRDFDVALGEHLLFLRSRSDNLHPRLVRQLSVLERLFPDR